MQLPLLANLALATSAVVAVGLGLLEGVHRSRDRGTVGLSAKGPWSELPAEGAQRRFGCRLTFANQNQAYELTLKRAWAEVVLLTRGGVPHDLTARANLTALNSDGRRDGYWAATLLGPASALDVDVEVVVRGAPEELATLQSAALTLRWEVYGRTILEPHAEALVMPAAPARELPAPRQRSGAQLFPIPTHLLGDADDLPEVVARYTAGVARPGDVVAIAESVVALTQGRARRPEAVRPGFWAQRLCYFVPSKGSLSSPYGFQTVIDEEGVLRVVLAFFAGMAGKVVGQAGLFYRLAGRQANLIDDVTGTMPPYDQMIVPGPADPDGVVERIKARTGLEAAIVDVNDLKKALVVAATGRVDRRALAEALLENPHGNDNQQTPIVLVRPEAATAREGVSA